MGSSYNLSCRSCGKKTDQDRLGHTCSKCGGVLEYLFDPEYLKEVKFEGPISFWRYRYALPHVKEAVSLGEGGTPLWVSERLGSNLEIENLKLKDETRNPTSSFKDRSASLIVSDAVSRGFDTLVSATSGNHGASLAAYCAKEGLTCNLIMPSNMDIGKLAQMIAYDAEVDTAGDNIEHAISQTVARAIWKGFKELYDVGKLTRVPRLIGVQAEGCSPITNAFRQGKLKPS